MNYFSTMVEDDYVGFEKHSYLFHMLIAVVCVPLYLSFNILGFITMPYIFFMVIRPRSCYLLPLIIHFSYSVQSRYAFCVACFLYVLFNHGELVRYRLHWLYLFYLAIMPFFIWFTVTKFKDVQNYVSMSGNLGGINTYFLFGGVFWGYIAIKKLGRSFMRHFTIWNFILLAAVSVFGTDGNRLFTRQIFYAIPYLGAVAVYCICRSLSQGSKVNKFVAMAGVIIYILNFVGILRLKVTFTLLGLLLLSAVYVYSAMKRIKLVLMLLNPKILFITSFIVVMLSASLVLKYRGLNEGLGEYSEFSNTSVSSLWKKLQMKAIDDRASLWALSLERIKEIWHTEPIFVDTAHTFTMETDLLDVGRRQQQITVEIPSHNVMLELLRSFGFYGGLLLYVLYVCIFISPRNMKILRTVTNPAVLTICAVCVVQGALGGHTGQYTVQPDFGSINFVLLGACWRYLDMHRMEMEI